jgi:hypothetical protein
MVLKHIFRFKTTPTIFQTKTDVKFFSIDLIELFKLHKQIVI